MESITTKKYVFKEAIFYSHIAMVALCASNVRFSSSFEMEFIDDEHFCFER